MGRSSPQPVGAIVAAIVAVYTLQAIVAATITSWLLD